MGILKENWTVWWARVYFEDSPDEYKKRPVIIIDGSAFVCTALKVTSQRKDDRYHVELIQWKAAGLSKPSWVEIGKKIELTEDSFGEMIGKLDYEDVLRIVKRLSG
ncbi:MAG: type II toxin-antitoxin system PemK/MazF family toxin [Lachnospiraceae bacterium]|nr:type II toxin-antitoxin system PemK/MazF family toxin [Lachnospiraceae bacterium]